MKLFLLLTLASMFLPALAQSSDYPGRTTYPTVKIYETDQLNDSFKDVIIVDARSAFEYNTLHINNAINIPFSGRGFIKQLKKLKREGEHIVFYCNGHTCYKAYKAALKASKAKIRNVFAYDSGIFDWANAHPEKATLLGKSPVNKKRLLTKKDLKKHLLEHAEFSAKATDEAVILDIREASQRGMMELYPYRQENISMDQNKKMNIFLKSVKKSGKTLLVYDEAGKQVRWLQYYLKDKGITNYFFLEGGLKKFFKNLAK